MIFTKSRNLRFVMLMIVLGTTYFYPAILLPMFTCNLHSLCWFCSFCYNNIVNFDKEFSHINQVCSIEHGLLSTCQNLCYWYRGIFIGKFWQSLMSTRSAKHTLDYDHLEISFRGIQQQVMQHIGHNDWNNRNEAFTQLH